MDAEAEGSRSIEAERLKRAQTYKDSGYEWKH